jgi:type IV fimbrial biogenesis protein FimT
MRLTTFSSGSRSGFSLVELLIAVTLLGLLLAIAAPRVQEVALRQNVRSARAAVANLYSRARIHAVQNRVPVTLQFGADSTAWITTPLGAGLDTIGAVARLGREFGVAVGAAGSIVISPLGMVNAGTPISVSVTKYGHSDSITISGYGRLQ